MKNIPLAILCVLPLPPTGVGAEVRSRRVDIHVDGGRPIAGERSRFAVSPQGDVFFTYTLVAGDFSCKPLGRINRAGEIRMLAIDSESTWNVEGWATYGFPFDLAFDAAGELHIAARHRGKPYGVDYWRRVDGVWRLESFAADVTYGGNNVSLGLLPDAWPVVVCLDRNRTQLAVWERGDDGGWSATRPSELSNVVSGQFDLVVHNGGVLRVLLCPTKGGPVCATRDAKGQWTAQRIAPTAVSRMIAATLDDADQLHVSFASGDGTDKIRELNYAALSADGTWRNKVVAKSDDQRHVGLTDITAAAGRVAIAWEHGAGQQFAPKDYGGKVGSVMLTVIGGGGSRTPETSGRLKSHDFSYSDDPVTHELVPKNGGRPGLALSPDGKTAWVGVYTGNDHGDDFYLLKCRLDDGEPTTARVVNGDPARMFHDGCLKDIGSRNEKAERRGLQRIDLSGATADLRQSLIGRYLNHDDPLIRKSIVRELASSPDAVAHFSARLANVLDDPDRLVRKTFLEGLAAGNADQRFVRPVFEQAIASDDAMTRLCAAEVLRQHPDWVRPESLTPAMEGFARDLDSEDATAAGSAAMALERMIDVGGTRDRLRLLCRAESPLQRVRAALILFRCGENIELSKLAGVPTVNRSRSRVTSEMPEKPKSHDFGYGK